MRIEPRQPRQGGTPERGSNPVSSRTTTVRKNCRAQPPTIKPASRMTRCSWLGPHLLQFRGSRSWLFIPRRRSRRGSDSCPASAFRRARPIAPRTSAGARAPWSKWKGPAREKRSAARVGSGPFTPRKALAPARAALRFARRAKGGRGAPPPTRRGIRTLARACVRGSSDRSAGTHNRTALDNARHHRQVQHRNGSDRLTRNGDGHGYGHRH